jgi:hypothetical protein
VTGSTKASRRGLLVLCVLMAASLGAERRQIVVHGFRNPATGLEVREGSVGLVVGFSPNIIDKAPNGESRTTWFTKTGLFLYPLGFEAGGAGRFEPYLGVSLVQGLGNDWNVSESVTHGSGVTFDGGLRWASAMGLDLRLGAVLLAGFDGRIRLNPAPGVGWTIPMGEKE